MLRWYPLALGLGGLAGGWRTAEGFGAASWPAHCLTILCLSAWLTITTLYAVRGGGNPSTLAADLRHPEQGFAVGYISVIPMLLAAQIFPHASGYRYLDLALVAAWAVTAAAIVAQWITTPRDRHAIHPGFSLPVVAGPFIASISLQTNGWHLLAQGLFAVGAYFWVTFGTLIIGRLMTEQRLSDARFPTLVALMVPPATAGTAWFTLNSNKITTAGVGLAAVLAMMALVQLFILPDYLRRPFGISSWVFSFPLAATANTVGHWAVADPYPGVRMLAWSMLAAATAIIALLVVRTGQLMWSTTRRQRNASCN
ncbi:hypothetical protein BST13_23175 [Mycobacterium aquaticum]|uniref:C4-dicarboxylate ABC transporter n=1 Tax=Mycobacterium aquaticum TaxID=1927124 RepID=A0A1X0APW2_9MYCO|nr:hypothetical protein BST13_23175 [Mycobacterium aquaticum]